MNMKESTRAAILAALKSARDLADAAETAGRDLTAEERGQVTAYLQKAQELKKTAEDEAALRAQLSDLSSGIGLLPDKSTEDKPKPATFQKNGRASVGQMFIESGEYTGMMKSVPQGRFSEKARVQSQPFGVKALVTGVADASAGALIASDDRGLLAPTYERPLTIRQLVTNGTTTSDTIEYVRVLSTTNNAAPVAEATTSALPTQDGSTGALINAAGGGYKPESGITLERDSETVKTIAHWIPATKRALSDAAQIRTLIDAFLRYGLEEELEDQMVSGSGVGENFTGLTNVSGVQTQDAPDTGEDVFTVTRRARRKVRIGGRARPTAYAFNPIDWENIELMRNEQGNFYGAGPFAMMQPSLWGLPVVESEAIPEGTAYCADWSQAVLYDREQASIQVTDSHADFFVRNLVAILAEMRAAFVVLRPAAFVRIDLAA